MSAERPTRNLPASIRQRLLNLAHERGEDFQGILDRYAVERLLYRLSISGHRNDFLLKGALLFAVWIDAPHRPTRDADLLGFGEPAPDRLADSIGQLCAIAAPDGITYDATTVKVEEIRLQASYPGLRVTLRANLDGARCNVQLDVGFGDAVTPAPAEAEYPGLLPDLPAPRLRMYPRETVCAEKLEAIALLGIANSRLKDYFDLLALGREGAMDTADLARAIAATFERRGTPLPEGIPLGLSPAFATDPDKRRQWDAFLNRNRLDAPALDATIEEIVGFLDQPLARARGRQGREA